MEPGIVFNCKYFLTHPTPQTNKHTYTQTHTTLQAGQREGERERETERCEEWRVSERQIVGDTWRALIFASRCWNYTNCNLFALQTKTKAKTPLCSPLLPLF